MFRSQVKEKKDTTHDEGKKDAKERSCDDDEEEQLRQGTLTVRDLIPLLTVWRSLRIERAEGRDTRR